MSSLWLGTGDNQRDLKVDSGKEASDLSLSIARIRFALERAY